MRARSVRSIVPPVPVVPPAAPEGYRSRQGTAPRPSSPARDVTTVHLERADKERLDLVRSYLSRRGRTLPLWEVVARVLDTSPLLHAALAAEEREAAWLEWLHGHGAAIDPGDRIDPTDARGADPP